jgi:paraquat-inducible protein A
MRCTRNSIDRTLALTLTGLILFAFANSYPFITFELEGREQQNILITGVIDLLDSGYWVLGILVFGASILAPLLKLLALLYVLLPLKFAALPPASATAIRLVETLSPWAMTEVYMLGVLVAVVKLAGMATIELGVALYCFAALILVSAAASAVLDEHLLWQHLESNP